MSDLSLSLSRPSSLSSYFLSPVQLRRGSDRAVLVGTWHLSRPNQNSSLKHRSMPAQSSVVPSQGSWTARARGRRRNQECSIQPEQLSQEPGAKMTKTSSEGSQGLLVMLKF